MPGVAGVGVPSLSEIQAWDITHLENAARDWAATAQHWESSFSSIQQAVQSPGGTVWRGAAAEAAWTRASTDLGVVRAQGVEVLHASAAVARQGASTLSYAKQSVLNAVDDARAAGHLVSENLMVTPVQPNPVSMAQAQLFTADIQERAGQLVAHDKAIAAAITTTSAPLHTLAFNENSGQKSQFEPVVNHWKEGPDQPGAGRTGQDVHDAIKDLPKFKGRDSLPQIRSEEDLRKLWDWSTEGAQDRPPPSTYPGNEKVLPDGTVLGLRDSADNGLTMDVKPPDGPYEKVHINAEKGGVPNIPGLEQPGSAPIEGPAVPEGPRPAPAETGPVGGPSGLNPMPRFVEPPHSHHGPPIVGRDNPYDPQFGTS